MNKLTIKLIKKYQSYSQIKGRKYCKYEPTCSSYALGAFQKFGFIKAFLLSCYRILRCNPFSKGGYDPVPDSNVEKLMRKLFPDSNKK